MTAEQLSVRSERVDDVPLVLAFLQRLGLAALLEKTVGTHGNTRHQNVLGNGQAFVVWLTFLLTQSDHRKVTVAEWVARHTRTLAIGLGVSEVPATDFSDDRLSTLLDRLQRPGVWEQVEAALLARTLLVTPLPLEQVHLDSTSTWGFHAPDPDGVMRFGHAKGGGAATRTQVKLMAATTRTGQLLACTVWPGDAADPPLYQPLIARIRHLLGQTGLLYVGDSKLGSLATRADLAARGDYYLTPLAKPNREADPAPWLAQTSGEGACTTLVWRQTGPQPEDRTLIGGVQEVTVTRTAPGEAGPITWEERVLLVYAPTSAARQEDMLQQRLREAQVALRKLTPPRRPGVKRYATEAALQEAVAQELAKAHVPGLLTVTLACEAGTGRRPDRYVIAGITGNAAALEAHRATHGWRVFVTNAPVRRLSGARAVLTYREEYVIERDFHLFKDTPLGISPLFVQTAAQITGLMCFVTLGVRVLTLLETAVAEGLGPSPEPLTGLYAGLPTKPSTHPTAVRLLQAFVRAELTLTGVAYAGQIHWHLPPLSPLLQRILAAVGVAEEVYTRLTTSQ